MKSPQARGIRVALIAALSLALAACGAGRALTPPSAGPGAQATKPPITVRVSILPILESLPTYVADAQGYFAAQGIQIEYVPVASSAARDQLFAAGQLDAGVTDMVSTSLINRNGPLLVIVRFGRVASSTYPDYRILAGKDSGIHSVAGLRGVPIAVSQATVIQYVTERMLEAQGFQAGDIQEINIPNIGDRMSVLVSGKAKAATIPDPLASQAISGGAYVVMDDTQDPQLGNSELDFTKAFIDRHPQAVRGFLQATEEAVRDINGDKQKWIPLLESKNLLSPALAAKYILPDFPLASVPSEAQWADVIAWDKSKGILSRDVPYSSSVSAAYLPQP
ncbi:MAG: ABC transporter substrate-binding protein [Anaerolineales bacterium]